MENPEFLKKKYELHKAPEVEMAAKAKERKTGEKVSQKPAERIQNYLDRLKNIINPPKLGGRPDFDRQQRNLEMLKTALHNQYVINPEEIPESYFETQKRIAREQGRGDIEITAELKQQRTEVIITDQQSSLDNWIDYLASSDATYPDWLKYYAIRSILNLGDYDKEKKSFTKRSKDTVKPFPDLNREALAYVLDAIEKKYQGKGTNPDQLAEEDQQELQKLLQQENFGKLYAWAIEKATPASKEALITTQGKWVKYDKGSDHMPLVKSLQGHGTNWCTAGESTAQAQLEGGDFYVYYSRDEKSRLTIPRVAIRMQGNQIAEVRGIAEEQNLDPQITGIVQKKLKEFPDGPKYEKKNRDMQFLTEIENKTKENQPLTKDELLFLYETESKIEGFGYQRDPRIKELRDQRNPDQDISVIFECTKEQIAHNPGEINENTKAYVGKLEPDIFTKIQQYDIEHVYTSFPEGRIKRDTIESGGKDKDQLIAELKSKKNNTGGYAEDMLRNKAFTTSKNSEQINLVRLTVKDLFSDSQNHTTQEIYQRAQELGLELCPAEVGPNYRLQYQDQPMNEWLYIGMKQITDRGGGPDVFRLVRRVDGLWLRGSWADPALRWLPVSEFVFVLRK